MGVNQYFVKYFLKGSPDKHFSGTVESRQMDSATNSFISILIEIKKNHSSFQSFFENIDMDDIVIEVLTRLN